MAELGPRGARDAVSRSELAHLVAVAQHASPREHVEDLVLEMMVVKRAVRAARRKAGEIQAQLPRPAHHECERLVGAAPVLAREMLDLADLIGVDDVRKRVLMA